MSEEKMMALEELSALIAYCYDRYHVAPVAAIVPIASYSEICTALAMSVRGEDAGFTVDTENPVVYGLTIYPSHFVPKMLPLFGSLFGALAHQHDTTQPSKPATRITSGFSPRWRLSERSEPYNE